MNNMFCVNVMQSNHNAVQRKSAKENAQLGSRALELDILQKKVKIFAMK